MRPELSPADGERVNDYIIGLVSIVAVRRSLPPTVIAIIKDPITTLLFTAMVHIEDISRSEQDVRVKASSGALAMLGENVTPVNIVDSALKRWPGISFVCDDTIAEELSSQSITYIAENRYRLEGRPNGVAEIYTSYPMRRIENDDQAPPDTKDVYAIEEE